MGLLDEFRNEPRRVSRRCGVSIIRESMDKKTRDDFDVAIDDVLIQASTIARVLERKGIKTNPSAIARHRRGDCCCE
jgi:hypothetical protein